MNVFISWSGSVSHDVARLLKEHLPVCLPALGDKNLFISDGIRSGSNWFEEVSAQLARSDAGLVCMTHNNLSAPWLLYEAGALSRTEKKVFLCGLLLGGLEPKGLSGGPLGHFQHRPFTRSDLLGLVVDLNQALPKARRATPNALRKRFDSVWAKLQPAYKKAVDAAGLTAPTQGAPTESYRRLIPRVPRDGAEIERLGDHVEHIRKDCLDMLGRSLRDTPIGDDDIRVNVFVPDSERQYSGVAFDLYMHPRLRFKMNRVAEHSIRFPPGEGGTGTVFDDRRQRIEERPDFALRPELKELLDPRLRWFISTPIKGADGIPLAILNLDGLGFDAPRPLLEKVAALVKKRAGKLAEILDSFPKSVITIQQAQVLGNGERAGSRA